VAPGVSSDLIGATGDALERSNIDPETPEALADPELRETLHPVVTGSYFHRIEAAMYGQGGVSVVSRIRHEDAAWATRSDTNAESKTVINKVELRTKPEHHCTASQSFIHAAGDATVFCPWIITTFVEMVERYLSATVKNITDTVAPPLLCNMLPSNDSFQRPNRLDDAVYATQSMLDSIMIRFHSF
jgi:hypothetical protein